MKRKNLRFDQGFRVALGNTSRGILKRLDFYVPPAYDREGDELPPGKP